MYKKGLLSLLLSLFISQSAFAIDWSVVRSGGVSYVNSSQSIMMGLYFYARSGERLSLNHFGGPSNLFCGYSSIDNPGKLIGTQVIVPNGSMKLRPRATTLYIVACTQASGQSGDNVVGVLKTSSFGKNKQAEAEQSAYDLSEMERDILLEELHEYIDSATK